MKLLQFASCRLQLGNSILDALSFIDQEPGSAQHLLHNSCTLYLVTALVRGTESRLVLACKVLTPSSNIVWILNSGDGLTLAVHVPNGTMLRPVSRSSARNEL